MLNTEKPIRKFTTNCINCLSFYYILRPCDSYDKMTQIVIVGITEEEERKLNEGETISIQKDGTNFNINPDLCFAYGELNLSPNSKDINTIHENNLFANYPVNISMVSEYNYDTHTVTSDIRGGRWYYSNNPKVYLPYLHGCIGKPKRVAIFKEYVNTPSKKKAKKKAAKTSISNNITTYKNEQNRAKTIAKRKAKVSNLKFTIKK